MNIEVGNVSYMGAIISWSSSEPCLEDYYHIMYRPNWNSIFSGYLRYSFHHEEKVPRTISSVVLEHLTPSTLYFLCISCKKILFPYRHYCTMFHTLDKSPLAAGSSLVDPQISLWVLMAILLACFTAVLAFICLQFWCIRCHEPRWSYRAGHMEEANGLVRWPEEAPALGQGEEDLQGLPLVELPRKNSGAEAEPEAAAADAAAAAAAAAPEADQDAPDLDALQREGGDHPVVVPHFGE
ncbi:Fibronectin type III domain-containing protein 9 [Camelus dromedarius]|uniref:Fibronectin type III domain-containing protein 9 n=1 Tax=Camelus dromedarius TaxID=9838 RepID=A0A5N4ECJ9_CAMDR|nr:fibronectin type III domain-containing protein 9 [Camelus dromedarius]KAB1281201.1 Fibronectin type III domain-containing protein 9 [Camelus dromedarius]